MYGYVVYAVYYVQHYILGASGKQKAELLTCSAGLPAEALEGPKTFKDFPIYQGYST